jgi:ferritin
MEAALTYMRISTWFESRSLSGIAGLMKKESQEEFEHAWAIIDYINKRNGEAEIRTVAPREIPLEEYKEVFRSILELEVAAEKGLHDTLAVARTSDDYATETFLHEMIKN